MEITDTICDVDKNEWENLTGSTYMERSYLWFKTVEESGMRDMSYVLVREGGNLVAAAVCFPYVEKIYNIQMPFLEVRSPLGTSLTWYSQTPEHTDALMKGLDSIHKKTQTKGTFILDLKEDEFTKIHSHMNELPKMRLSDNTYLNLEFDTFEDYLQSLSSRTRRSIRNTLNKADRWNITTVFTHEFSKWKDVTRKLQKYICEEHDGDRFYLTGKFYDALEKNLKDRAELAIFFKDDIPLAFGLALNSPEFTQYKFVGIDPEYKEYQAYFLIYYEGIKRAIEHQKSRIYFGPSSYDFKDKIGCIREEHFGIVQLRNPVLHLVLKMYLKFCWWRGIRF
ncbi:MAG: GNAT family N-acetyltransferase [Candidatus Methanofastidiosia archaeon]|jgi:predicted N-acyltransferase